MSQRNLVRRFDLEGHKNFPLLGKRERKSREVIGGGGEQGIKERRTKFAKEGKERKTNELQLGVRKRETITFTSTTATTCKQ